MYIENLVETHCHILPAIDDGSKNVEMSLEMIKRLQEQGVKKIVLTPHYYSDNISLDDFLRNREKSFNALAKALPPGSPELYPAAEVYISDYLFNCKSLDELKIAGSDYVLIEHSFSADFDGKDYDRLINMYCDYGVRPVLAHIERYRALMDDVYKLDEYMRMGCLTQVNISSFTDSPFSVRKKLIKLLESGRITIVGSDSHNLDRRPPEYGDGISRIIKKCGQEAVDRLVHNANQLVK